jgi:hypothetical protein
MASQENSGNLAAGVEGMLLAAPINRLPFLEAFIRNIGCYDTGDRAYLPFADEQEARATATIRKIWYAQNCEPLGIPRARSACSADCRSMWLMKSWELAGYRSAREIISGRSGFRQSVAQTRATRWLFRHRVRPRQEKPTVYAKKPLEKLAHPISYF